VRGEITMIARMHEERETIKMVERYSRAYQTPEESGVNERAAASARRPYLHADALRLDYDYDYE